MLAYFEFGLDGTEAEMPVQDLTHIIRLCNSYQRNYSYAPEP